MKKLVIIFNGPPNSGKDYAARVVTDTFQGAVHLEFKKALREVAHYMVSLAQPELPEVQLLEAVKYCNLLEYARDKSVKDTVICDEFGGRTWRQFLIWISETVLKPIFGQDIFGRAAAKLVQETDASIIAFSDGGFQSEVDELLKLEGVTVVVVQLHRDGCEWGNDSRGYINSGSIHTTWSSLNTASSFATDMAAIVEQHLQQEGIPYALAT
jgi:hypothetical protein